MVAWTRHHAYRGSRDELLYIRQSGAARRVGEEARSGEVSIAAPVEFAHLHKALPVLQTGG